jgi:outer membrane murein-binding lipoprotein Lpp
MFKSIGFPPACVALLLLSTQARAQDPKSDIESLKAELARARSDLDATKKELAKVKADLESLQAQVWKVMGPPKKVTPADVQAELLKRWNEVAAKGNYEWKEYGNFPHPTFRGGSGEAYGAFAKVLVAFLQKEGNFEYLAKNGLFTVELETTVPGGSRKGTGWTFAGFAKQFSDPKTFAKLDDETRKAIQELAAKIDALTKK